VVILAILALEKILGPVPSTVTGGHLLYTHLPKFVYNAFDAFPARLAQVEATHNQVDISLSNLFGLTYHFVHTRMGAAR
jgi:hypothetical protein